MSEKRERRDPKRFQPVVLWDSTGREVRFQSPAQVREILARPDCTYTADPAEGEKRRSKTAPRKGRARKVKPTTEPSADVGAGEVDT